MAESTANADLDVGSLQDELKSLREQRSQVGAPAHMQKILGLKHYHHIFDLVVLVFGSQMDLRTLICSVL